VKRYDKVRRGTLAYIVVHQGKIGKGTPWYTMAKLEGVPHGTLGEWYTSLEETQVFFGQAWIFWNGFLCDIYVAI